MTIDELKKLIEEMEKGQIEDNRFTVVDEDEHQLLGRINLLIAKLKELKELVSGTENASKEAVKKAEDALQKCIDALEYAKGAYDASNEAKTKAQEAIDKTLPLDTLIPQLQTALQSIEAVNQRMDNVEQGLQDTSNTLNTRMNDVEKSVETANDTAGNANKTASSALEQARKNETKNTEQDGTIANAQSTADGAVEMNNTQNERLTEIEKKDTAQDGRLTALETKDTAHDEKLATLEQAINDEATTRASQDTDIRGEINRLMSSESDLNEEILTRLDTLETDKADATETANHFSQVETSISNINAEQKTQNDRLTAIETKDTEQDGKLATLETQNKTQDTNISKAQTTADGAVTKNTEQDQRLQDLEDHAGDVDTSLASMTNTITDNNEQFELFKDEQLLKNHDIDEKDKSQDTSITLLQTMMGETQKQVTANASKNTEQDKAIEKAQQTADGSAKIIVHKGEEWVDISDPVPLGVFAYDSVDHVLKIGNGEKPFFELEKISTEYHRRPMKYMSWEEISAIVDAGEASTYFEIGETKDITCKSGRKITMQLVGIDHDTTDASSGHSISMITKELWYEKSIWSNDIETVRTTNDVELDLFVQKIMEEEFPDTLKSLIKTTTKYTSDRAKNQTSNTKKSTHQWKIWVPSEYEMGGSPSGTSTNEGTYYPWYKREDYSDAGTKAFSDKIYKKMNNGSGEYSLYWTRSQDTLNDADMKAKAMVINQLALVNGYWPEELGSDWRFPKTTSFGVVFGFCL